jgi:hypothetical protein
MGGAGAYEQDMDALSDLPDNARIRLLPVDPPLDGEAASALLAGLEKLFRQFARDGRVTRWAAEVAGGGAVLIIAYLGAEEISGCSQDTLARLLHAHEQDGLRRIVAAPPIVVEVAGIPRCVDRAGLRRLTEAGEVSSASVHWDVRVTTLGEWRQAGRRPIAATWLADLLARLPAGRGGG